MNRRVRAVTQRVSSASVRVGGEVVGSIGPGLLVYVGIAHQDSRADVQYVARKVAGLRIFEDAEGKMAHSVVEVCGEVLVVSQFTLFGDVRRGRRPSFEAAAPPDVALRLYEDFVENLRAQGLGVETGAFRATMAVDATVAGPVTILIDSNKTF